MHARQESNLIRGVGIPSTAPKAVVLPLHYGRKRAEYGNRTRAYALEMRRQALKACVLPLHQLCEKIIKNKHESVFASKILKYIVKIISTFILNYIL